MLCVCMHLGGGAIADCVVKSLDTPTLDDSPPASTLDTQWKRELTFNTQAHGASL